MWNGNSAYCNSNSYGDDRVAVTLPWVFRAAMGVPVTQLIGE